MSGKRYQMLPIVIWLAVLGAVFEIACTVIGVWIAWLVLR